ncbi:ACP S-malonyltransferase [Acholeplasma hippikon]|nr:ACP S-malonyltransferase [Acholeplasma hippikon]
MKLAVLFAGQGAQVKDMGLDFINLNSTLKTLAEEISKYLDFDFIHLLSDEEKINDTRYTQPLMIGVEILIYEYLKKMGLKPDGFTGFSLGEYAALYASGIYDIPSIMKLIDYRAQLMSEVSKTTQGKMAAILGLEDTLVDEVCKVISNETEIVVAANFNSSHQTVISGSEKAVLTAIEVLKEKGAKRALLLNVSGAFHSPYMKESGIKLRVFGNDFKRNPIQTPLYKNTDANRLKDEEVLDEIEKQIYSPVYFKQTIEQMVIDGYTHFLEIGPGSVLTSLVKKINPDLITFNVSKVEDIEKIKGVL